MIFSAFQGKEDRQVVLSHSLFVPFYPSQINLQMGFLREEPWLYLSGDKPELLDIYPELGYLRDIVYLLKAFMAPTSDALPEVYYTITIILNITMKYSSKVYQYYVERRAEILLLKQISQRALRSFPFCVQCTVFSVWFRLYDV